MKSPNGTGMSIKGGIEGYASSERSGSESSSTSENSSSPTSTARSSISEHLTEPLQYPLAANVIASPPTLVTAGNAQYLTNETRVMADTVAQARKASELPPTQSSPLDVQAVIEDYTLLTQLRLARGDPALPPPEGYTRLRVEAARRIRDRDSKLQDEECQQAATERVEGYLRVVGQERRYYDLAREMVEQREVAGHGKDIDGITDEVMAVVKRGIGTTAESLDMTAGELDSAACLFSTIARSLGGSATTLDFAATNLDSTASSLESTLGVMAAQIGTLNTQLLALTNILQSHSIQTPTAKLVSQQYTQQSAAKDPLQERIERAIREAILCTPALRPHRGISSMGKGSYGGTPWSRGLVSNPSFDGTAMKTGGVERGTERRASRCRYLRIVIDRILG